MAWLAEIKSKTFYVNFKGNIFLTDPNTKCTEKLNEY